MDCQEVKTDLNFKLCSAITYPNRCIILKGPAGSKSNCIYLHELSCSILNLQVCLRVSDCSCVPRQREANLFLSLLITLHARVNVLGEQETQVEPSTSQHQKECIRNDRHVPKVKRRLEHSRHPASVEVVKEGVAVNKQPRHSRIDECAPPPPVVLARQLEVKQRHANEARHNDQ